jgi:hypothetical protein
MGVDLPIDILFCLSLQLFQESTGYQHTPGGCMIKGHLQNQCLRTSFDPSVNSMPTPNLNISKEFHRPNGCPHLTIIQCNGQSLQKRHTWLNNCLLKNFSK